MEAASTVMTHLSLVELRVKHERHNTYRRFRYDMIEPMDFGQEHKGGGHTGIDYDPGF